MFRFITEGPENPSNKRKQSQRACHQCRRRKKRCVHIDEVARTGTPFQDTRRRSSRMQRPRGQTVGATTAPTEEGHDISHHASQSTSIEQTDPADAHVTGTTHDATVNRTADASKSIDEHADSWFVGDLNPEGIFSAMTDPDTVSGSSSGGVGVWLFRKVADKASNDNMQTLLKEPRSTVDSGMLSSKVIRGVYNEQCLRVLPGPADTQALTSIYTEQIHPIFPVIDTETYFSMQDDSPSKAILAQVICLAASSNKRAEGFLTLPSEPTAVSSRTFVEQLSSAIRLSLDLRLVTDKFVLIQVLTLLSLFSQLSADNHNSADLLSQAVSYAHTLGLHLQPSTGTSHNGRERELFCCLWTLDRLNAAFHGRPVMMHERDISRDLETCFQQQTGGPFKLLLRIVLLLDKVIDLYRPLSSVAAVSGWESMFPPFEDLLHSSSSSQTSPHLLATAETLYHAVAMLSCRQQSLEEPVRSSASYVRQCLSADKVTWIVGEEFRDQLSKLPIIPYAVSLALRFYYRELRLSKAPYFRTRARKNLLRTCATLRPFGDFYSSATVMVQMVEKTIREMDRAYSSMASTQHNGGAERAVDTNVAYNAGTGTHADFADSSVCPSRCSVTEQPLPTERYIPEQRDGTGQQPTVSADANGFDQTLFDNVPGDIDIFEYFDPGFDLNAIDAAIGIGGAVSGPFPTFPVND